MIAYIVQPGDTLSAIAARFNVTVKDLVENNVIRDDFAIFPGQILFIPRDRIGYDQTHPFYTTHMSVSMRQILYVVQRGDTLTEIARRFDSTVDAIVEANNLEGPNAVIYPGQILRVPVLEFAR